MCVNDSPGFLKQLPVCVNGGSGLARRSDDVVLVGRDVVICVVCLRLIVNFIGRWWYFAF